MTKTRKRALLAGTVVVVLVGAFLLITKVTDTIRHVNVVGYFDNSNGVFVGDDVLIRGVAVGKIAKIEPEPNRVKISFWFDDKYRVPSDAKAVILSPTLVTARSIQLTPPYTGGPVMGHDAVIPQKRTAVPVEWDEFRTQLQKLTQMLQPTQPGGVSTLGEFINTAAANLHGQAPDIHDSVVKLSQTLSALGDHSDDTFTSVRNLATLVTGLQQSTDLMSQLNTNFAAVTALLTNSPDEVANAVKDFNGVVADVKDFVADNRETLGTATDKLASISQAATGSLDDIKQLLHIMPTTISNAVNAYQPAQGTITGIASINNFRDPIGFLCGAVQAASRLGAEQAAKLCVQYLAPIIKNRQYNFPPIGVNPFVGASARPNEITYSEDWMRPDYIPPQPIPSAETPQNGAIPPSGAPLPPLAADQGAAGSPAQPTDPAAGLPGMMLPTEQGPR